MDDIKTKITDAITYIENHYKVADEETIKFFDEKLPAFKTVATDASRTFTEEQLAYMLNYVIRWANQLTFILFRKDKLSEESRGLFLTLVDMDTAGEEYAKYGKDRESRMDNVLAQKKVIDDEIKTMEIFVAELQGISKEEAEQRQADYEQRTAATQE